LLTHSLPKRLAQNQRKPGNQWARLFCPPGWGIDAGWGLDFIIESVSNFQSSLTGLVLIGKLTRQSLPGAWGGAAARAIKSHLINAVSKFKNNKNAIASDSTLCTYTSYCKCPKKILRVL
jgi:hypothetical protein